MKNQIVLPNKINALNLQDANNVNHFMSRKGLYVPSHGFPLASLQFELTAKCNMLCKHCYNCSGGDVQDAMTPEKWISFSKYLVKKGGIFECILSGGEPFLLGDALFKIMDILNDDGTLFMLLTNGYFLTPENTKLLKKYQYHWLQISIDGVTAEYHDNFRQLKGSWERAISGARLVSRYNIPLKIAHCVTPQNLTDIDQMCDLAYSLGASSIMIGELCLSGRTAADLTLLLSGQDRLYLSDKVKENQERFSGKMIVKTSNSIKKGLIRHKKRPNSCAVIRPNGDVRLDGMAPFVIGNILNSDFSEIWSKVETCWKDPRIDAYIKSFSIDDRNYSNINYSNQDIYI